MFTTTPCHVADDCAESSLSSVHELVLNVVFVLAPLPGRAMEPDLCDSETPVSFTTRMPCDGCQTCAYDTNPLERGAVQEARKIQSGANMPGFRQGSSSGGAKKKRTKKSKK